MLIGNKEFDFGRVVYLMGILNVTPDSFSDGGKYLDPERALQRALRMEEEGADLIDVGGESTRPGADPVPVEEELRRVLPVLQKVVPRLKIPVSIDTRKAAVAERACGEGAAMVNDVSALRDPRMGMVVAERAVPIILMHMRGEPKTMQEGVHYDDVVAEILSFLEERIGVATAAGVLREKILIDPGIGFGKRFRDNLTILTRLGEFGRLECPLVFGASRKSFVRRLFGEDHVAAGSVTAARLAAERGASLLRVHDVREMRTSLALHFQRRPAFSSSD